MENKSGNAEGVEEGKFSTVKDTVDSALYQLERMFIRMAELPLSKDMRDPMHEVLARNLAAIYLIQSMAYPKPSNHDEIVDQASIFDDIKVKGLPVLTDFRKAK